jgi:hypothetical protein
VWAGEGGGVRGQRIARRIKGGKRGLSRERERKESMLAGGWDCDEGEKWKKGARHP